MIFKRVASWAKVKTPPNQWSVWLLDNNWDDFNFKTSFEIRIYDPDGNRHSLGTVKISKRGHSKFKRITEHPVPPNFEQLPDDFFSVGQDEVYYSNLKALGHEVRVDYLTAMRDIAFELTLLEAFDEEESLDVSLLRNVHENLLKTQYHRLAHGKNRLEAFGFAYQRQASPPISIEFDVRPESHPPTNVHVLIGSNGVGKTTLLKRFADFVRFPSSKSEGDEEFGFVHSEDGTTAFWNLVAVAFSAFDSFGEQPIEQEAGSASDVKYFYFGLKTSPSENNEELDSVEDDDTVSSHKSPNDLVNEFRQLLRSIVKSNTGKFERFAKAIKVLSSDPLIASSLIREAFDEDEFLPSPNIDPLVDSFKQMSSGHKIVLLSIAGLVNRVDEKTLVLIDEPETHLHPPLLSAYIRAVSNLLIERNGVAIVATHSPVVLQEVPKSCVWKLSRQGDAFRVDRPEVETFGENVGTLTREVFGLEVTQSGFFQMVHDLVAQNDTYEEVVAAFDGQLGAEGRAMARILFAEKAST